MLEKFLKINKKGNVNIWLKKSSIKFNKKKTALINIVMSENNLFLIKEGIYFEKIKTVPSIVFELINDEELSDDLKKQVNKDGFFYFNGKKIDVKELL